MLYDPDFHPGARLSNLAVHLIGEGRKAEAIAAAIGAVTLAGDRIEPYTALSGAYDQVRGFEHFQIAAAQAGLALLPNDKDPEDGMKRSDLLYNMSIAQNRLYQWETALKTVNEAHHLNPINPWALGHAAQMAGELRNYPVAVQLLSGAIRLIESEGNPYNDGKPVSRRFRRDMYLARAITLLEMRDFSGYFRDFEKRLELSEETNTLAPLLFKKGYLWRPGGHIGNKVLIVMEQGLGDQIEFARLARTFRMGNPHIDQFAIHCHPAVSSVIESMDIFDRVFDKSPFDSGSEFVREHGYTAVASLDLIRWAFESRLKDIFGAWEGPYVHIDGKALIKRKHATQKTAIGFCWQGNPDHVYDWARSVPYQAFLEWADSKRDVCTFHSLQHGKKLIEFPEWIEDCDRATYGQLAEVVNACDVIVGPDTGVLHLAGAMGKPAVMLHTVCQDWRWKLPIKIYGKTFRHLVQKTPGDWTELLSRLGPELDGLLNTVEMAELTQAMAR